MKFRNYCLVVIGNTIDVLSEIEKISETKPNILDGGGLVISTFSSTLKPAELTEWFTLHTRNFLIFDLATENSGFNFNKTNIHQGLFGFLKTINLEDKSAELLREIQLTSDTRSDMSSIKKIKKTKKETEITEKDIDNMSKDARMELWNNLIDNGVDNLTENDKKILQFLAKY